MDDLMMLRFTISITRAGKQHTVARLFFSCARNGFWRKKIRKHARRKAAKDCRIDKVMRRDEPIAAQGGSAWVCQKAKHRVKDSKANPALAAMGRARCIINENWHGQNKQGKRNHDFHPCGRQKGGQVKCHARLGGLEV